MALILAIEPDRRQAARISALGRGTLDAEVLVADSTERGVAALHGRHPDLILTSLLLSPKDEAGLRDFEKGGLPVPTLMIPVLAGSSRAPGEGGGLLARLQRKTAESHEGCDPKVFAAQIAEYLMRVREERELREIDDEPVLEPMQAPETIVAAVPDPEPQAAGTIENDFVETESAIEAAALDTEPTIETELALDAVPAIESEPVIEALASEPVTEMPVGAPTIDAPLALTPSLETRLTASTQVDTDWEEIVLEEQDDAAHHVDVDEDVTLELSGDVDLQAFVDELKATYADLFPVQEAQRVQRVQQVEEVEPVEPVAPRTYVSIVHELPYLACWPSLEGIAAEDTPAYDEFVADFVAAMDEPENPQSVDSDSDLWMPLSAAPGLAWPRLESTCSKRPNQDEWGFYDPDKCGLSAVVAKLDQVTR